ncbi:hypothetical protein [Xanthomonas cucurbitae]|uniref:Uncharacterized protein n=1 Tax=Xanthomonas cucurbitae TaxID=56453 RepID=A0ABY7Y837_9XANT|nr:hypothetical protein [Xanthomonas cucurbitae]WDM66119.1 hypothetical protein K6981_11035 [Xanthomonas cucurbitae]WDM69998.1 hypothetical protein K6978_11010 [Xanthomonas cucurbitae]
MLAKQDADMPTAQRVPFLNTIHRGNFSTKLPLQGGRVRRAAFLIYSYEHAFNSFRALATKIARPVGGQVIAQRAAQRDSIPEPD